MPYLIVRTDIRPSGLDEITATVSRGARLRDEHTSPEIRRQTVTAEDRDAALHLARALAASGPVRSGRQRVKVIRLGV